jgi:ribosomal-protein-alanine N-acetyltransferase
VFNPEDMPVSDIPVQVRPGTNADISQVLRLLDQARRQYLTFGEEDLKRLISTEPFILAGTGPLLWGFCTCATESPPWASLRGIALINGWKTETGMRTLMLPMHATLRKRGIRTIYCLGHESWLPPALMDQGYHVGERVVTYERPAYSLGLPTVKGVRLRPVGANDLDLIGQIDQAAFTAPWAYARRELIYLLMSSSHSIVAELGSQPVGYAISDVKAGIGQVIRLAVLPSVQGQGVGQLMLVDAVNACHAAGATLISLNTQASNANAQHLYEATGFRRSGRSVPVLMKEL